MWELTGLEDGRERRDRGDDDGNSIAERSLAWKAGGLSPYPDH